MFAPSFDGAVGDWGSMDAMKEVRGLGADNVSSNPVLAGFAGVARLHPGAAAFARDPCRWRRERGELPQADSMEPHPLGPFELASRLSYCLWSSAPDDELLRAAAGGSLTWPSAPGAVVDRMLDDPRSERFVESFTGEWLGRATLCRIPRRLISSARSTGARRRRRRRVDAQRSRALGAPSR
jgi:hypothetical protein